MVLDLFGRDQVRLTWGTHLGETKEVASMTVSPVAESLLMSSTLTLVGTAVWGKETQGEGDEEEGGMVGKEEGEEIGAGWKVKRDGGERR